MHAPGKPKNLLHDRMLFTGGTTTVLMLVLVFSPMPAMGQICVGPCITVNAGPIGTDTPDHPSTHGQQNERLFRDGIASTCAMPKVCPALSNVPGLRNFDAYEFANTNNFTICVEIDFTPGCGTDSFTAAYLDAYDPNNLCANYLADPGSSFDMTFSFEVPPLSNFIVVVHEVNAGVPCADYSFVLCGLACEADLSLTKTEDPDPVVQNMPLTYTLMVTNNGPDPADTVVVEDTLPAGVSVNAISTPQGGLTLAGNLITFELGALQPNDTATMTIEVMPDESGVITNTAEVSAAQVDPDPSNNSATVDTAVLGDADGDGVLDQDDPCPNDAPDDSNGDGVCDSEETTGQTAPGCGNGMEGMMMMPLMMLGIGWMRRRSHGKRRGAGR